MYKTKRYPTKHSKSINGSHAKIITSNSPFTKIDIDENNTISIPNYIFKAYIPTKEQLTKKLASSRSTSDLKSYRGSMNSRDILITSRHRIQLPKQNSDSPYSKRPTLSNRLSVLQNKGNSDHHLKTFLRDYEEDRNLTFKPQINRSSSSNRASSGMKKSTNPFRQEAILSPNKKNTRGSDRKLSSTQKRALKPSQSKPEIKRTLKSSQSKPEINRCNMDSIRPQNNKVLLANKDRISTTQQIFNNLNSNDKLLNQLVPKPKVKKLSPRKSGFVSPGKSTTKNMNKSYLRPLPSIEQVGSIDPDKIYQEIVRPRIQLGMESFDKRRDVSNDDDNHNQIVNFQGVLRSKDSPHHSSITNIPDCYKTYTRVVKN